MQIIAVLILMILSPAFSSEVSKALVQTGKVGSPDLVIEEKYGPTLFECIYFLTNQKWMSISVQFIGKDINLLDVKYKSASVFSGNREEKRGIWQGEERNKMLSMAGAIVPVKDKVPWSEVLRIYGTPDIGLAEVAKIGNAKYYFKSNAKEEGDEFIYFDVVGDFVVKSGEVSMCPPMALR